ncbi:MAG: pyridoxamine 5'-phosphate oxidase family protein, partial [Actinomycetota bacterium]
SPEQVEAVVEEILEANHVLSPALTDAHGDPHSNAAYYAGDLHELVIFTPPLSVHAVNAAGRPSVAAAVIDNSQPWDSDLRGLQILGPMDQLHGADATGACATHAPRFPGLAVLAKDYSDVERMLPARFLRLSVLRCKIPAEADFGKQRHVIATLHRS